MNYNYKKNVWLSLIILTFLLLVYAVLLFLMIHFNQNEKSVIGTINLNELSDFGNMIVSFTEIFLILSILSLLYIKSIKPNYGKCILYATSLVST